MFRPQEAGAETQHARGGASGGKVYRMNETRPARPWWAAAAVAAVAFGVVTVIAGGRTLFGAPADRAAAGNIVPFVLWFNFIAGFAYVAAGAGIFLWRRWAATLSALIAIATVGVFMALGVHILNGGLFETRTVAAMTFRSLVWIGLAMALRRAHT